jgi:methyl-accepting chemotaxis protein
MTRFARLTLATQITLLVTGIVLIIGIGTTAHFVRLKTATLYELVRENGREGLSTLAHQLANDYPLVWTDPPEGFVTALRWDGRPLMLDDHEFTRLYEMQGIYSTFFRLDTATGTFVRDMTNVPGADGRPMVGVPLDRASAVAARLLAGDSFTGPVEIAGTLYLTIYEPVLSPAGNVMGALAVATPEADAASEMRAAALEIAGPMLALMLVAILGVRAILMRTLRPLREVTEVIERLAKRDHGVEIAAPGGAQDMARLQQACVALRGDLVAGARLAEQAAAEESGREKRRVELVRVVGDLRGGLARLAEGDLSKSIPSPADDPFPAEYETLRQSYNAVLERVSEVIDRVSGIARAVHSNASEIAATSRDLSQRAETQAATLEQSAAALTELTQSVAETAERAGRAEAATGENRVGAERGAEVVSEAVRAMTEIERGSEQITRIIGVIDEIAFQTNLLALNAGVEAARAGDAGRGFAVVASEVRLLAQRASESAREIKALISESSGQVTAGSALVRRAGDSLDGILQRAHETAHVVAEIASAAGEQARGLAEVNAGVNHLDTVTQRNSAAAEESSATAAMLQERSAELIEVLSGFRTATGGADRRGPMSADAARFAA